MDGCHKVGEANDDIYTYVCPGLQLFLLLNFFSIAETEKVLSFFVDFVLFGVKTRFAFRTFELYIRSERRIRSGGTVFLFCLSER